MANTITKPTTLDYLAMGLTAVVWASAFIAIKVVVPETGPLWLAAWRVLIGFLVMVPYVVWKGIVLPSSKQIWTLILIAAIFNAVLPFFLISWASKTIDAGVAALLMGTGPFMAVIGSHFSTSDDRITLPKVIAVLLGFSGVLLIVGVDALKGLGGVTLLSQLAAVGGAMSYVVAGLLIRKIDIPPVRQGWLVLGTSTICLFALALLIEGAPVTNLTATGFWTLIYLGLIPTGLGQILRFTLIRKVGYAVFSLSLNLIPVLGIGMGALLLGEQITLHTFVALCLVLAGLFVSRLQFGTRKSEA